MPDQTNATKAHCTIMVYVQGDDTLANFAVQSLRELKRAANENVIVAAQFKANEQTEVYRYIFGKGSDNHGLLSSSLSSFKLNGLAGSKYEPLLAEESISINIKDSLAASTNMADPQTLYDFLDWAYKECPAESYSLAIWGEGCELLLNEYVVPGALRKQKSFLTPGD